MNDGPQRRFQFTAKIGADSRGELASVLSDILADVLNGQKGGLGGGVGVGYEFKVDEDPEMTSERYHAELRAWLDSKPVPGPQNPPRPEKVNQFA